MKCNLHCHFLAACLFVSINLLPTFPPDLPNAEMISSGVQQAPSGAYSIKIIAARDKTYGYEIYQGKKLVIRQENIPGFPGMKGFRRKSDAEKVARLVTEKLSKGIMPPTVEKAEMEKLKVQF